MLRAKSNKGHVTAVNISPNIILTLLMYYIANSTNLVRDLIMNKKIKEYIK